MAEQYKEYVCNLDEKSLKKAREELNEDPADRMNAVESFRKLIQERAPHLTCSMEADFLLRFLRVAKFSQLEALNRLERYLDIFNTMDDWTRDIDMMDPEIQAFLDEGYWLPLGHDDEGCPINMFTFGAFDPEFKKYTKTTMYRAQIGVLIYLMWDERSQVNGFKVFADLTTFQMKHQIVFGVTELQKIAHIMNGAMPVQWKDIYYYNTGPIFEGILNIVKPFQKKELRDRLHLCGNNLAAIYDTRIAKKHFPVELLPDDYTGPTSGVLSELKKNFKAELSKLEVVERIKYETSSAFRLDESKRPKDDVPLQSFGKVYDD